MNIDRYIIEIDALINYIDESSEKGWVGALDNISNDYINLLSSVPYNWFFTQNILYSDIMDSVKGNLMEFDALKHKLIVFKGRLETYKNYGTEYISVKFEDLKKHIISEINRAEKNIEIAVAWLSDENIISNLNDAILRNVSIKIIMIDCTSNQKSSKLLSKNIDYIFAKQSQNYNGNFMHNKFSIFDNSRIITGSSNWSKSASYHDENIMIVFNDQIASQFSKQFYLLWCKYNEN